MHCLLVHSFMTTVSFETLNEVDKQATETLGYSIHAVFDR